MDFVCRAQQVVRACKTEVRPGLAWGLEIRGLGVKGLGVEGLGVWGLGFRV